MGVWGLSGISSPAIRGLDVCWGYERKDIAAQALTIPPMRKDESYELGIGNASDVVCKHQSSAIHSSKSIFVKS